MIEKLPLAHVGGDHPDAYKVYTGELTTLAEKINEIIDVVNDNQKALVEIFRMLHELNPSALPDDQVPHA